MEAAVKAAGPTLWAGADDLTVEITRRHLSQLAGYPAKADYIARVRDQSRSLAQDEKYPADLKTVWNSGRQDLAKLSVELYATHFRFTELWAELRAYLDEFGADGKHSRHLFGLAINTLNRARAQKIDFDPRDVPDRAWFDSWHERLKGGGTGKVAERLAGAWDVFSNWTEESLPLGPVAVADLARDPRLRAEFTGQFSHPTLRVLLERMTGETGVSLRVGPTTDPELVVAVSIHSAGPLLGVMRMLAEFPGVRAEWERTADGYVLHSAVKGPAVAGGGANSSTMRLILVACNVVVVLGLVRWLWIRQRKPSAGTIPSTDDRTADS